MLSVMPRERLALLNELLGELRDGLRTQDKAPVLVRGCPRRVSRRTPPAPKNVIGLKYSV